MPIHILSGPPGSGKTTYGKQLASQHNTTLHSWDDIPGANTTPAKIPEVRAQWLANIKQDLESGKDVVIDGTNLYVKERVRLFNELKDFQGPKILYVFTTPLDLCLKRNAQREGRARIPDFVITQSHEYYQAPTLDEGWDQIITI